MAYCHQCMYYFKIEKEGKVTTYCMALPEEKKILRFKPCIYFTREKEEE